MTIPDDRDELLRLASALAIELKAPLSAVQTVLGSVLGGFTGPLDARQRWVLKKAWQRCAAGMNLVGDLVRLRNIERLQDETLGPVNLMDVLHSTVDGVREAAGERELDLDIETRDLEPDAAWMWGDEDLVRDILQVLLENAVGYTPSGGSIQVRFKRIETEGEATRLCIEVVDNGIGIPPEGYERIFHELYRAPNARSASAEGTGLGLAFAWRAAKRLGGRLRLEPAATGGVRARVDFPDRPDLAGDLTRHAAQSKSRDEEQVVSQFVVIVGGATAGSKAAARIMRLDPQADVTIVERGRFLAYSGCGLPYYISGAASEQRALLETPLGMLRDAAFFHDLKNVRAHDLTETLSIDRDRRTVAVRNLIDGKSRVLPYDQLILATGARPVIPDLPGVDLQGIHTLYGIEDAEAIRAHLHRPRVKDVVIVGGGLLGSQITEAVSTRGTRITLVEECGSILGILDEELALLARRHLEEHGVRVITGNPVASFFGEERVHTVRLEDGTDIPCDFVILSVGRRPNVQLPREAGLEIGDSGAIWVDASLRTSDPHIFAAGDCTEQIHRVTGRQAWLPGAVSASMQARVAANNICGGDDSFPGIVGSTIVKLFDWAVARTGLTEAEARAAGFDPVSALIPGPDRVHFDPSAKRMILKLVADRDSGRILGAQGIGAGEVAKRIDVVATALTGEQDVDWLAHLHLAYAPPYSQALDNVLTAANVVRNKLDGRFRGISSLELQELLISGSAPLLLDVRQPVEYREARLRGSRHIPLGELRGGLAELPRDRAIVVVCSIGLRSYEASLILTARGFEDVRVLDGGLEAWPFAREKLS